MNEYKHHAFSKLPLFLIVFLDLLGFGIIIPILGPLFLDSSGGIFPGHYLLATRTLILGFLIATYSIAQFFGAPILGALSDRHGRKKVLLLSLFGSLIGYLIFGMGILTKNVPLLFLSRILSGFTGGNISTVISSIADISDVKSKAKNFGLIGMAFGFGFIIGPYIGGKLADPSIISWFNYSTPLFFSALLALISIFLVLFVYKETLKNRVHSEISLLTGFRNIKKAFMFQNLRTVFIVVFLLAFGFNFFVQFFPVFLIQKFNFSQSRIGDIFGYAGLWVALTQGFINRPLSKKFSPSYILSFSSFFFAVFLIILLIPDNPIMLFVIIPFVALFQGLIMPNSTAVVSNLGSKDSQGEIIGINQSMQSLAQAFPPIISGFVVALHMNLPILVGSIFTFAGWLIFMLFFKTNKEKLFKEV